VTNINARDDIHFGVLAVMSLTWELTARTSPAHLAADQAWILFYDILSYKSPCVFLKSSPDAVLMLYQGCTHSVL
jgi:hypothetical protein